MMTGFRSSTGSIPWGMSLPASSVPEQLAAARTTTKRRAIGSRPPGRTMPSSDHGRETGI